MALPPPLGLRLPSEPLSHPPEAPRELGIAGCTICPASGGERIRLDQAQKLGQDSMDPPQHFQGGLRGTAPAAGPLRLPTPSTNEDPDVGKHCEHLSSGREVLEAEQDSLSLCLLGLGLQLQDLEQGLGPWASAQSRMGQLQALQADLRAAAERVDALLVFGEGLAQRSEPQARASLEQILRALRAHRSSIFRRLWWLQAQLVSYSMVWPTLAVPAPGHAHVGLQPPETLGRSPKTLPAPAVSGQEPSIFQFPGCDVGGRPWSPCSCIRALPDLPPSPLPPLPSPGGCHVAPATVRGVLLLSCPTVRDTLPGAQLCQWSAPNLST
ncbi:nesprin-4 isoform X5 [Ailuropoda melanoleuca]|uniref:nesprin-4 isoform X5 n=1 Tax=Ailuropoda melanoleuca TaxID=9646 RepID=UPI0014940A14|nr:nesprin-4 isoform X5 [Ailuropoda melanoleuca]